jgi:hypothetical protein
MVNTLTQLFCYESLPKNVAEYVNKVVHPGVGDFPAKYPLFPLCYIYPNRMEEKNTVRRICRIPIKITNNNDFPEFSKLTIFHENFFI